MASNEASQAHTHDSTRPAKAAAEGGTSMQEIKAVSSDSNRGVPNQYTHPQINFTRDHASWKRKNFVGTIRDVF